MIAFTTFMIGSLSLQFNRQVLLKYFGIVALLPIGLINAKNPAFITHYLFGFSQHYRYKDNEGGALVIWNIEKSLILPLSIFSLMLSGASIAAIFI